ncbi:MAG: ankyrin repeat domain-containing protein [Vulcanimicrobiota bacterium]
MEHARELFNAVMRNDLYQAKELIESGQDVNIWNEKIVTTKFLASRKPQAVFTIEDYEKGLETPLHIATRHGYTDMACLLVAHGADLEARDLRGNTPLHLAARYNQPALMQYLLTSGAKVNAYDQGGWTALYWVSSEYTAAMLLDHGADLQGVGEDTKDPLHHLALMPNQEVALLLIRRGAEINRQDGEGKTPLHWATCGDNRKVVDRLLMEGARTGVRDNDGKTAMDYAREKNIPELVDLLHRYSL